MIDIWFYYIVSAKAFVKHVQSSKFISNTCVLSKTMMIDDVNQIFAYYILL